VPWEWLYGLTGLLVTPKLNALPYFNDFNDAIGAVHRLLVAFGDSYRVRVGVLGG